MNRERTYLILAILGAVVPYLFFIQYFGENGVTLRFISALFENGAAGGFTADLLIASLVFWIWMFKDARERGLQEPWLFLVLNLTIGLSCALPAYLYQRERAQSGSGRSAEPRVDPVQ